MLNHLQLYQPPEVAVKVHGKLIYLYSKLKKLILKSEPELGKFLMRILFLSSSFVL